MANINSNKQRQMQNINKVVIRQSDKDYTTSGVIISNTKNIKTGSMQISKLPTKDPVILTILSTAS